jgi:hypothetical protein
VIFGLDELRGLAECDARAGEPLGKALRWAADRIEALEAELSFTNDCLTKASGYLASEPITPCWCGR